MANSANWEKRVRVINHGHRAPTIVIYVEEREGYPKVVIFSEYFAGSAILFLFQFLRGMPRPDRELISI